MTNTRGERARSGSASLSLAATTTRGLKSSMSGRHWSIESGPSSPPGSPTTVFMDDLDLIEARVGKLRCLEALGDYSLLLADAKPLKHKLQRAELRNKPRWKEWMSQVLLAGTKASFALMSWKDMEDFISTRTYYSKDLSSLAVEVDDDPSFYEALLKIQKEDFTGAEECIHSVKKSLAPVMSSLLKESYTRAYRCIVTAQQVK